MKGLRFFMLVVMLALCTDGPFAYAGDEAADKKELQRIKRQMREKKNEIKRADRKERSILSELEKINRDIQGESAELSSQQKRLQEAEATFREVELRNAEINRELAGLKLVYGRRLRALYKMNRSGYAAAVFTAAGLDGVMKRAKYLGVIAERDRALIREYGGSLERLAARQAEISEIRADILARKSAIEVKRSALTARRRQKAGILSNVKSKKSFYEQSLRELEEASAGLWVMIKKEEQKRKADTADVSSAAGTGDVSNAGRNRLSWPLEGQVLTRFGMQRHPRFGTMVFRRGIEIEAREGESVLAVEDGQVAYADWYKGYGKLLILDHGNGFYTLYGDLSRVDPNKGDRVSRGQVIGLAGDTGGAKGAKLYFEIRRNGEAQDPIAWLVKK